MGVLVAEASKSFALVTGKAPPEGPGGESLSTSRIAVAMIGLGHSLGVHTLVGQQPGPVNGQAPGAEHQDAKEPGDLQWAPPRPKKKWLRHFYANEETPPSHEEFPSSFPAPELIPAAAPQPLLNGRLSLSVEPAPSPIPAPVAAPVQPTPAAPRPPSASLQPYPTPQSTPPPQIQQQSSPQPAAPAPAPGLHYQHASPDSPGASRSPGGHDDDLLGHEGRRRTGSGTREVHNKLEKNRRAHLKECFEVLKRQLPTCQEEKKVSNLSILHSALRYIQTLRRKEREYEHEMERLAREKIAAQQRLATLKKDLAAQWDHIDVNALLPDCVDIGAGVGLPHSMASAPSPASTSTASAELEGGMIIDEDDDDDDTMSYHSGRQRTASDSSATAYYSPQPAPAPAPPALRDLHGYRGESPQAPLGSPIVTHGAPLSPRPGTGLVVPVARHSNSAAPGKPSPGTPNGTHNGVSRDASPTPNTPNGTSSGSAAGGNTHHLDTSATTLYKLPTSLDRNVAVPVSGYPATKLVNYSMKVASPASAPAPPVLPVLGAAPGAVKVPSPVGSRVPSSPVGTLTNKSAPVAYRSRNGSPPVSAPASSSSPTPAPLLQSMAVPLTSHHIQIPAQGRWVGHTIQLLAAPSNQRVLLDPASLTHHNATTNGGTRGVASSTGPTGSTATATATAAISVPTLQANKMMVGATSVSTSMAIVNDGAYHKTICTEGVRHNSDIGGKNLQISSEHNGQLLTTLHPGSASMPAHLAHVVPGPGPHHSLTPLVSPVTVVSQGSPVTHILATSNQLGKVVTAPLIKTVGQMPYLGAVVKPTMVVVSSASTLPPHSGV